MRRKNVSFPILLGALVGCIWAGDAVFIARSHYRRALLLIDCDCVRDHPVVEAQGVHSFRVESGRFVLSTSLDLVWDVHLSLVYLMVGQRFFLGDKVYGLRFQIALAETRCPFKEQRAIMVKALFLLGGGAALAGGDCHRGTLNLRAHWSQQRC